MSQKTTTPFFLHDFVFLSRELGWLQPVGSFIEFLWATYCWMEVKTQPRSQCWQNTFCLLLCLVPCSLLLCVKNPLELHQVYGKRPTDLKSNVMTTMCYLCVWIICYTQRRQLNVSTFVIFNCNLKFEWWMVNHHWYSTYAVEAIVAEKPLAHPAVCSHRKESFDLFLPC